MTVSRQIPNKLTIITLAVAFVPHLLGQAGVSSAGAVQALPPIATHNPLRVESIPIVVLPHGFARSAISLPTGGYALLVINRSGFRDLTVFLERMPGPVLTGTPLNQLFGDPVDAGTARRVEPVVLVPGTYRLSVSNEPKWLCAITVK